MNTFRTQHNSGFANLMGIMIIIAIIIGVTLSLLTLDTMAIDRSLTNEAALTARWNATSCTERALHALKADNTYATTSTEELERGTCRSETENTLDGDGNRLISIEATGYFSDVTQSSRVTLAILATTAATTVLSNMTYTEIANPN